MTRDMKSPPRIGACDGAASGGVDIYGRGCFVYFVRRCSYDWTESIEFGAQACAGGLRPPLNQWQTGSGRDIEGGGVEVRGPLTRCLGSVAMFLEKTAEVDAKRPLALGEQPIKA